MAMEAQQLALIWDPVASGFVPLDAGAIRFYLLGAKGLFEQRVTPSIASGAQSTGELPVYNSGANHLVIHSIDVTVSPSRTYSVIIRSDGTESTIRTTGKIKDLYGTTLYGSNITVEIRLDEPYTPGAEEPESLSATIIVRGVVVPKIQVPA